jgi:hypothetical protein
MLDRFESTRDLKQMADLVAALEAVPCAEAEACRVARLAERLVASQRTASHLHRLGAALYRAGRFEEATRTLEQSIQQEGKGGYSDSWLFLAMTRQRRSQPVEARRWLARFEAWLEKQKLDSWQLRLRWQLLHQEARALIQRMPRVPS